MTFLVYNLLLFAASPLLALYLAYRVLLKGKSRQGFGQRLGWAPALGQAPGGGRVWLHAVSAGEMVAASAIARRLIEERPGIEYVVSTTTPAGMKQAERLLPGAVARFYFPFDFLPCVLLALLRVRPTVVAAVETEVWPNWLAVARALGIRAALVNGQFADRGFRRARRARWLYRWALGRFDALRLQTERAAERALLLGAPADRVRVCGNVKFEQEVPVLPPEAAAQVRAALGLAQGRPLWIAGSTHPGEEEQVLDAYALARKEVPALALLLAPRHVERAAQVNALLEARGIASGRRSLPPPEPADVLVLDTMGELAGAYALAEVVYVGGSLVPIGGHDILQPLFQGKPTLFGPHMHNQYDLAALALEAGAAAQVEDAAALAEAVVAFCRDSPERERMRAAGQRLLDENRGAARECAGVLADLAGAACESPSFIHHATL